MTPDQIEKTKVVAERVMGFYRTVGESYVKHAAIREPPFTFDPFTNANDDVMVLEYVSKNWSDKAKIDFENSIRINHLRDCKSRPVWYMDYEVGDYTEAAYRVVMRESEADGE